MLKLTLNPQFTGVAILFAILLLSLTNQVRGQTNTGTLDDTNAPQVVSLSISPAAIDTTVSSQTVAVTAHVTDNLAGTRNVQVKFVSPSGGQVRFGSFYRLSGDDRDGTYQADVTFAQFSEAGSWRVDFIYTDDKANNTKYYYTNQLASAGLPTSLQVTSVQDISAPEVVSLAISPAAIDTTAGSQTVAITARVVDNLAGTRNVQVKLVSPSGGQVRFGSFYRVAGDDRDGIYQTDVTFAQFSEGGAWRVDFIYTDDKINNNKYLYTSQLVAAGIPTNLQVTSVQDISAPLVRSLTISPSTIDTTVSSQTVAVTARVTDNLAGTRNVQVKFVSPSGGQVHFGSFYRVSGDDRDGTYQTDVTFPKFSEIGGLASRFHIHRRQDK